MLEDLERKIGLYYEKHKMAYQEIEAKTLLWTDHLQANKEEDSSHIDYIIPSNNPEKKDNTSNSSLGNAICEE